jgi:uncharacterized protein YndB with AHSA1/START domain
VKLTLTYTFHTSPQELFETLFHPHSLRNWMAESVDFDEREQLYTFHWGNFSESARLIEKDSLHRQLKFEWVEGEKERAYLAFSVFETEDDEQVDLQITDFCEANEARAQQEKWDEMMKALSRTLA